MPNQAAGTRQALPLVELNHPLRSYWSEHLQKRSEGAHNTAELYYFLIGRSSLLVIKLRTF